MLRVAVVVLSLLVFCSSCLGQLEPEATPATSQPTTTTVVGDSCDSMGGTCLSIYSRIYCRGQKLHTGCYDNDLEYCCTQL